MASRRLIPVPDMESPRLAPVPDPPPPSIRPPPESASEGNGTASASSDRNCAPSRAPISDAATYDQLSYSQLHAPC